MQAINFECENDALMKKIGLITGVSNEMYFCSISNVSTVYVERLESGWIAWRESNYFNGKNNYKVIASGSFELVLARTKKYLKYIEKQNRKLIAK